MTARNQRLGALLFEAHGANMPAFVGFLRNRRVDFGLWNRLRIDRCVFSGAVAAINVQPLVQSLQSHQNGRY
jgi:hypothetical protein